MRKQMRCVSRSGADKRLVVGNIYTVGPCEKKDAHGRIFYWVYGHGAPFLGFKTRFEEIEMKTPPEPCKCKQTAPVQQPRPENNLQDYNAAGDGLLLTRTDWRIARNTLAKLEQQLRCGVAKPDETYEIIRTVTHILKG